jgi:hypothetical protein
MFINKDFPKIGILLNLNIALTRCFLTPIDFIGV